MAALDATLRHEAEHLAPRAQPTDGVVFSVAGEQATDHLGIHGRAPGGNTVDGLDKLGAVEHSVFKR